MTGTRIANLESRINTLNRQIEDLLNYISQNLEAEIYYNMKKEQLLQHPHVSHTGID